MAYKATIDGEVFFTTEVTDTEYTLLTCVVEKAAGSAGRLTFTLPFSNVAYNNVKRLSSYIEFYKDTKLVFAGRVSTITERMDTSKVVECEGMMAVLIDSQLRPFEHKDSLHALVEAILDNHNNQVEDQKKIRMGHIDMGNPYCYRNYEIYESSLARLLDLQSIYGGWMQVRKESGLLFFDWHRNYSEYTNQTIRFRTNLTDLVQKENSSDIVTVLIPLGVMQDDGTRLTIKSVNNGLDYLVASQEMIDLYGYIWGSEIWEDVSTPSILKTRALQYFSKQGEGTVTINATAVDLADTGEDLIAFDIGQRVRVISKEHGLEDEWEEDSAVIGQAIAGKAVVGTDKKAAWFNLTKLTVDIFNRGNNKIQLGLAKEGYVGAATRSSQNVRREMEMQAQTQRLMMESAIYEATALITGAMGGYVVMHDSDGDEYPDEILVMDSPSIETAVNVWRFNQNGLGFSSTGYDGNYGLAMTINGAIVADYITVGTMVFDRLRGGTLSLGGIDNQAGAMVVYDASGREIGRWDKDGATITGDITLSKSYISENIGSMYAFGSASTLSNWTSVIGHMIQYKDSSGNARTNWIKRVADQYVITTENSYSRTICSTPGTNIEGSSRPTTGVAVTEFVYSYVNGTGSLVRWYSIQARDLSNTSKCMNFMLADHAIYFGNSFITSNTALSNPSGTSSNATIEVTLGGFLIQGGTAQMRITSSAQTINTKQISFQSSSAKRYKHDITEKLDDELDPHRLLDLTPVQYQYNDDAKLQYEDMRGKTIIGFLADEVEEKYPAAAIHNSDGEIESWDERRIIPGMLALIKEQQEEIEMLKQQIKEIKCLLS